MDYLTIALPKGKLFAKSVDLLAKVGYAAENVVENSRKLVITNEETKVKFIIVKTVDLPTYVEYGAADIGMNTMALTFRKSTLYATSATFGFMMKKIYLQQ